MMERGEIVPSGRDDAYMIPPGEEVGLRIDQGNSRYGRMQSKRMGKEIPRLKMAAAEAGLMLINPPDENTATIVGASALDPETAITVTLKVHDDFPFKAPYLNGTGVYGGYKMELPAYSPQNMIYEIMLSAYEAIRRAELVPDFGVNDIVYQLPADSAIGQLPVTVVMMETPPALMQEKVSTATPIESKDELEDIGAFGFRSRVASRVTRLRSSEIKEAYDKWATSYDGIVLRWMMGVLRSRQFYQLERSLNSYLSAAGFQKPPAWDPATATTIFGDFGVDLKPTRTLKRVYLSDSDALYLINTLNRLQSTRQVEAAVVQVAAEQVGASEAEVKAVVVAETARDHAQHLGDEALKAIEERDQLREQNKQLRAQLDTCRRDTNRVNTELTKYKMELERYKRNIQMVAASAPPPPPPPSGPPPVPTTPPPPVPPAGAPTAASVTAAKAATTQTVNRALDGALQDAIRGFSKQGLKKPGPREPRSGMLDVLRSAMAKRRDAIEPDGAQIKAIMTDIASGKLILTEKGKLVPSDPCAVCGRVSRGCCPETKTRVCSDECLMTHVEARQKD